MKTLSAILVILILPVAIVADPPPTKTPFTLKVGESKVVQGLDVTVGFTNVPADSRCPSSVVCIWEGDAAVFMWLQQPGEERVEFDVHTSMHFGRSRVVDGYIVFLVDVSPYPVYGGDIDPADYLATITVTPATTAPTEESTWGAIKNLFNQISLAALDAPSDSKPPPLSTMGGQPSPSPEYRKLFEMGMLVKLVTYGDSDGAVTLSFLAT